MELDAYKDVLEFHPEFMLAKEPLKIDCVIIKKNIASIFRDWNLLEYKGPGSKISIVDFYKVYGYACLYASFQDIPITGLTVSLVMSSYPRELFKHLREIRGYTVEESSPGIYTISGDILPIQVINSSRLSVNKNLWLKSLSNKLDSAGFRLVGMEANRRGLTSRLGMYLYAIIRANPLAFKEALKMDDTLTLEQVLEEAGLIAKWENKGREEVARNALAEGASLEFVSKITGIGMEAIERLAPRQ